MSFRKWLESAQNGLAARSLYHTIMCHFLRAFFYNVACHLVSFILWYTWYVQEG